MEMKVLGLQDLPQVEAFERRRLEADPRDAVEKELDSWKARWRKESLDHYLSLGWSFGIWNEGELKAYLLGQPLLFFQGYTQALWVEYMSFSDAKLGEQLIDIVYRWSRDKHLQRVLFSSESVPQSLVGNLSLIDEGIFELKTSKYR